MWSWDEAKRAANLAKHGVDFAEAEGFVWTSAMVAPDPRRDCGETRWCALGLIGARVHVMVFTLRGADTRIISLRRANLREARRWKGRNL
jgi:uncharacterized protein